MIPITNVPPMRPRTILCDVYKRDPPGKRIHRGEYQERLLIDRDLEDDVVYDTRLKGLCV